jgi:DNA-binding PadR family transcriptional regulator
VGDFPTSRERAILDVLAAHPGERLYGLDITSAAGLDPGTTYPEFARLERDQWIDSDWQDQQAPKPQRRVYWLTPAGVWRLRELPDSPAPPTTWWGRTQQLLWGPGR